MRERENSEKEHVFHYSACESPWTLTVCINMRMIVVYNCYCYKNKIKGNLLTNVLFKRVKYV